MADYTEHTWTEEFGKPETGRCTCGWEPKLGESITRAFDKHLIEVGDPERCGLCGGPINKHDKDVWKQVVGWVGGPRKDSMRLREDTGRYAHDYCVAKLQAGQAIDQHSMFEEVQDEQPHQVRDDELPEELR